MNQELVYGYGVSLVAPYYYLIRGYICVMFLLVRRM